MQQLNLPPLATAKEAPEYFKNFMQHYSILVRYITQQAGTPLILDNDLKGGTFYVTALHNISVTMNHNLGSPPSIVCAVGGRYQAYNVEKIDTKTVVVRFKLLQCTIKEVNGLEVTVDSSALFTKEDKILLNGERRKLVSVFGNTLVLDYPVACVAGDIVVLGSDGIALAIY